MRAWLTRTLSVVVTSSMVAAAACTGAADDVASQDEALSDPALAPLDASELTAPLSKWGVRSTHQLASDVFETKWKTSLSDTPLMFLRAYPGAFHADLKQLARTRYPGADGLCVGDAHPDNFGYLTSDGVTTIYAFNDLDDSGNCVASIDALRYFAAFRLYFDDSGKLDKSLDAYLDEALGAGSRSPTAAAVDVLEGKGEPLWSEVASDALTKYTLGDAFRALPPDELLALDAATKSAVTLALASRPSTLVLDVAQRPRDGGGSGGLTRYWALAEIGGRRTILELKETATPGVDFGHAGVPASGPERLVGLKAALWDVTDASDYVYVSLGGTTFLVRDRTRKASADPKSEHREAQATYLGALHRGKWKSAKRSHVRAWLHDSSKVIAKRWKDFFEIERAAVP